MADFIRVASDFFDAVVNVITHTFESISAFFTAIFNIYSGISESVFFFPTFLSGILLSSFAILILLRIIGR